MEVINGSVSFMGTKIGGKFDMGKRGSVNGLLIEREAAPYIGAACHPKIGATKSVAYCRSSLHSDSGSLIGCSPGSRSSTMLSGDMSIRW